MSEEGITLIPRLGQVLVRPAKIGDTIRGIVKPETVKGMERPQYGVVLASGIEDLVPGAVIGWAAWAGATFNIQGERYMMLNKAEVLLTADLQKIETGGDSVSA